MPKKLKEFDVGWIIKDGKSIEAITVKIESSYHMTSGEKLMEQLDKMLSCVKIGAWRRKPEIICDNELDRLTAYCRYFPGKPEDYEVVKKP